MVHDISPIASFSTVSDTLLDISFPLAGTTHTSYGRRVMKRLAKAEGLAEAGVNPRVRNRVSTDVLTLRREVTEV